MPSERDEIRLFLGYAGLVDGLHYSIYQGLKPAIMFTDHAEAAWFQEEWLNRATDRIQSGRSIGTVAP